MKTLLINRIQLYWTPHWLASDQAVGEIPMAFVVKREGAVLEAEELIQYWAARVAPHKKVRAVEFVQEIPNELTVRPKEKE